MAIPTSPSVTHRPLEAIGISAEEEDVYRAVLAHRAPTAATVAEDLSIPKRLAERLLVSIEAKGLVTHTPNVPRVFVAASPEFILDALIKQREAALDQARAAIPKFTAQQARSNEDDGSERILELITNRAKLGLIFSQMYGSLRSEAIFFQRAPALVPDARITDPVIPPGVRVRTISDASFLEMPGGTEIIRQDTAQGEEARTFPTLPFKLMSIDRRVALITLASGDAEETVTLLVHRSALLDALWLLFDFVWEKATPIVSVREGKVETGRAEPALSEACAALIPLLSAGLNDKTIARELGMSSTTLNRRIVELMKAYSTRTRFQLGLRIAKDPVRTSKRPDGHSR